MATRDLTTQYLRLRSAMHRKRGPDAIGPFAPSSHAAPAGAPASICAIRTTSHSAADPMDETGELQGWNAAGGAQRTRSNRVALHQRDSSWAGRQATQPAETQRSGIWRIPLNATWWLTLERSDQRPAPRWHSAPGASGLHRASGPPARSVNSIQFYTGLLVSIGRLNKPSSGLRVLVASVLAICGRRLAAKANARPDGHTTPTRALRAH